MSDKVTIQTPENVQITYRLAGIGSRMHAIINDYIIQIIAFTVLYILYIALISLFKLKTSWIPAFFVLLLFILNFGYFIFFEIFWKGQTPGKKWSGIRVMKDNGLPADTGSIILRNILRIIDFLPFLYTIGGLAVFFHHQNKRLGDMIAGTIVIREKDEDRKQLTKSTISMLEDHIKEFLIINPDEIILTSINQKYIHAAQQFVERELELPRSVLYERSIILADAIAENINFDKEKARKNPERFIEEVVLLYKKQKNIEL